MDETFKPNIPDDISEIITYDPNSPAERRRLQEVRELAKKRGVPEDVADEFYRERVGGLIEIIRDFVEKRRNAWATLRQVFGDEEVLRRYRLARRVIFHFGGEELYRKFLASKIPVDPLLIEQFAKIGETLEVELPPEEELPAHLEESQGVNPWDAITPLFMKSKYGKRTG